jgi:hypothetical protein
MNSCPGSKKSIIGKTPRKSEDITELSTRCIEHIKKTSSMLKGILKLIFVFFCIS